MKSLEPYISDLHFILAAPRPSLRAPLARLFEGRATEGDRYLLREEADWVLTMHTDPNHPARACLNALIEATKN